MRLKVDQPLQVRMQDAIRDIIREQRLRPDDQLPTENELIQKLGVGRSTLREALSNLSDQGILYKRQGRGTFVRSVPTVLRNGIEQLRSGWEMFEAIGVEPVTSRVDFREITAKAELSDKLEVKEGTSCLWVERVRCTDEVIAAYCIDILPRHLLPEQIKSEVLAHSLFTLLARQGHTISHTESTLHPTLLSQRDLPELKNRVAMFLLFEEVVYSTRGQPLIYCNDYYSADVFEFRISRKRTL